MDDFDTITIMLDNDREIECSIITYFEVEDNNYVALLPLEEDYEEDVLIYRYHNDENDEPVLENITDDDEYEKVADAFDEFLDDLEYESLYEDEDEDEEEE